MLNQKIINMGFVCAVLVVAIHVPFGCDMPLGQVLFKEIITEGVAWILVPFYFIVSGYFIARHFQSDEYYKAEVGKRIHSLVIPYFLWSFIWLLASAPLHIVADIIAHRPFGTSVWLLGGGGGLISAFGFDLTCHPLLGPLWYVRCLFIFVLVCPLFRFLVDKFGCWWLTLTYVVLAAYKSGCFDFLGVDGFLARGISLMGIAYFSLGIYICIKRIHFWNKTCALLALAVSIALLGMKTALHLGGVKLAVDLQTLFIPFLLYAVFYFMPDRTWPKWLTSCAFPIFLIHWLFLIYFTAISKRLQINGLIIDVVGLLIGVIGSGAVAIFLRRYCKRTAQILFGGR